MGGPSCFTFQKISDCKVLTIKFPESKNAPLWNALFWQNSPVELSA